MSANSVNLITGPYRSGKSLDLLGELVDYLAAAPLRSRPAILTVPSHRYKQHVEERLAAIVAARKKQIPGLFGLKILPFYDLCHYVLRQTGQSFRILPDALRPAILEKAISEVKGAGRLSNLAEIADFAGTHAGMLELIDELERAGLSPSDVISTLSKQAATTARYMELARIYEAYWRELERLNIYDERKLAFKTREVLVNMDAGTLPIGFLAVDGFDRFNRLQLHVLSGLASQADRSTICFDYLSPSADPASRKTSTAPDLAEAFFSDRQTAEDYLWKEKSIRELHEVFGAKLLKNETPLTVHAPVALESFRALDRMLEIDELVRRLKQAFEQDRELCKRDVVVVVRSVTPYLTAIRAAFEKAEIEYFLDEPIELTGVPLVKYLLRLFHLAANDFTRQDVMRVLGSPFCRLEYLGLDAGTVPAIDKDSLTATVVSGRGDWQGLAQAANLNKLFDAVTPAAGEFSLTAFVAWIEDLIDRLLTLPDDEEYTDPRVAWEQHQALFELRKVLSNLILEENLLGTDYGDKTHTHEELLERLEKAMEQANFRRPRSKNDVVTVCGADLVPNCKFKAIFVAGLVEGEFPRRSDKPGFVSRDEVRQWRHFGIDIENPRHHESFEISLYKSLLERATDKLTVSSPLFEITGDDLIPSFFVSHGDDKILDKVPFVTPFRNSLIKPVSALDQASGLLWQGASAESYFKAPGLSDLHANLKDPISVVKARSVAGAVGLFGLWNGDISEPVAIGAAKIKLPDVWSVSRLNDFGKCGFRFWVSNVLKIKPIEEPEAGLDARLLGELYHKALELFYTRLAEAGLTILSADHERVFAIYEQCIADAIVWLETEKSFKRSEFWEYDQKEIYFRLRRFFTKEVERADRANGEFIPEHFEKAFGFDDEGSAPPLVLGSGDLKIKIRGKIDRLDRSTAGVYRVIDYKSGSSSIKVDEALGGRNMQLPVYAMALSQAIAPGSAVRSGSYLSIQSGEQTGSVDFEDNEVDVVAAVQENIVNFVRGVAAGKFAVGPTAKNSCDYCDHAQVCRISELNKTGALEELKPVFGGDFDGE